jgi:hypothetical protein
MLAGDYLQAGEVGSPKRLIPLIPIQPAFISNYMPKVKRDEISSNYLFRSRGRPGRIRGLTLNNDNANKC